MTWFWFSIVALLCWSGSDFFSKIGCRDGRDKYSQFKMVMAVGAVMGIHALYEIFVGGVEISWQVIWSYLPVSLLYIGSMTLGYVGLRYIELSISSPICNASGALVAIIAIITGTAGPMAPAQYLAIALACAGVIGLGFVEANEDEALRAARQEASNYKYAKSWLALALPIAYCMLDAAGTFADDLVLETLNEDSANVAYELTFLVAGVVSFLYTCVFKKQKLVPKMEAPKYIGAIFETIGQVAYIYALASGESALAAPIIASYCMVSVLWSRIFLKEKLSWKHYACIAVTFAGILIMGIYDM
ncbi:MAG: DMT family transporter [Firmicutes bacterium]|nr:DMT family transporter [Bacillota bacterium]